MSTMTAEEVTRVVVETLRAMGLPFGTLPQRASTLGGGSGEKDVEGGVSSAAEVVAEEPELSDVVAGDAVVVERSESSGSSSEGFPVKGASSLEAPVEAVALPMESRLYSNAVKTLTFGANPPESSAQPRFYRDVVKSPRVRDLRAFLRDKVGKVLPKGAWYDLSLASYVAGSVPVGYRSGQVQLKALENLGDVALAMALLRAAYARGEAVASVQELRSNLLSNNVLVRKCVESGLAAKISFPAGVNHESAKSGANAVEAVAGVLYVHLGLWAVEAYARWLKVLA